MRRGQIHYINSFNTKFVHGVIMMRIRGVTRMVYKQNRKGAVLPKPYQIHTKIHVEEIRKV